MKTQKLRGVARRAIENKVQIPVDQLATYKKRSTQTDEEIRHVLLYWMRVTVDREERRRQEILEKIRQEQDRQELIRSSKRVRSPKEYAKIQQRRRRIRATPVSNMVPGRLVPDGVRAHVIPSYRHVKKAIVTPNGVEEVIFEERID